MLREERHNLIIKSLEGKEAVSYDVLLEVVGTSSATLRRDVDQLHEAGLLRKVRGGVAPLGSAAAKPLQHYRFDEHAIRFGEAKDAIARAALSLVEPNDTLILYGGTTVARFSQMLPLQGLTVLTDSLPVANHLSKFTENRVFMTGGEVLAEQGVVLDPFDSSMNYHIAASTFFIGCHAVGAPGIMEEDPLPLRVARTLRQYANRLVVLTDSSKFSVSRSLVVFSLAEVSILVTDDGLSDRDGQMLEDAGVSVIVAPTKAKGRERSFVSEEAENPARPFNGL